MQWVDPCKARSGEFPESGRFQFLLKTVLVHMGNDESTHNEENVDHQIALAEEHCPALGNKTDEQIFEVIDRDKQRCDSTQRRKVRDK